jgi:hypothetical protein
MMTAIAHSDDAVSFLGIGAQKSGTTWMYRQLMRHPQVAFPRGKETQYWTKHGDDADAWVRMLQPAVRSLPDGRPVRSGEITPSYATLADPAIRAIHRRCPQIRLVMILRNPIERAWSAAMMELARSGMAVGEASDEWFIEQFQSSASRARGDYSGSIARWRSVFGSEPMLILLTEDLARDPSGVMAALAAHIGIDPADFRSVPASALSEVVCPDLGNGRLPPGAPPRLPDRHFHCLHQLYAQEIDSLCQLTGRDVSSWHAPSEPNAAPVARVSVNLLTGAVTSL